MVVVLIIIAMVVYFVAVKGNNSSSSSSTPGLVSTTAGATGVPTSQPSGIPTSAQTTGTPGSQVVALLRNLSAIQLNDQVFTNPSFALLTDLSVQLPEVTNQGRRNPFAPVGSDAGASAAPQAASGAAGIVFQVPN